MRSTARLLLAILLFPTLLTAADQELANSAQAILRKHCAQCHGESKMLGKLDSRSLASLLVGGKRGPAVVPGQPSDSRLIQLVQVGAKPHMPPGDKQLTDLEMETLSAWITDLPRRKSPAQEVAVEPVRSSPETRSWLPPDGADPTTVIDLLLQAGYRDRNVTANGICTDSQFARRLYLDLVARIPTVEELDDFLAETNSAKRDQLIDALVDSEEYVTRMAVAFDAMLMGRDEIRLADRKQNGWNAYLESVFRDNRPWNEVAREVLLARAESQDRGHIWYLHERNNNHQDMAEGIAKSFFGVDIACAQCHDHPLAGEILQSHYWGLVSFYNRSKNEAVGNGFALAESAIGGFNDFANALEGTTDQASLVFVGRAVVPEERPGANEKQEDKDELYLTVAGEPRVPKFSRREKFVDVVVYEHPMLARSMVNRIWALMMGRGIVHPPEKMDSNHPPSHPALLDWLARDFREHGYDIKRLVRHIARTRAYQLDSRVPEQTQPESFGFGLEKPLTAEAFIRSLAVVLDVNVADSEVSQQFRMLFPDILPENNLTTLSQAMMLSNRAELQRLFDEAATKLPAEQSVVDQVRGLYQKVFGREPADDELFAISDYVRARADRHNEAMSQVLWAMVCSAEFRLNH